MQDRIKVRVFVRRPNHLLQKLIPEMNLYEIKQEKDYLEIIIDNKYYEKLKKMKTIKELQIIDYYGVYKIKNKFQKYKILGLSIVIGILLNVFLSKFIFKIEIKTPNQELKEYVKKELYQLGFKPFTFKKDVKEITQIKKELLLKDRIEWLEIEEKGTKYIVTIEEKKKQKEKTCTIRNIVSKKKAIIRSIQASNGEILKKKNDYVEKGEILISGEIHNKEDIVSNQCAKGKVLGETWYRVKVEIPQVITKQNKKENYKWKIKIGKDQKEPNNWVIKKEYSIVKSNIYPFQISVLYLQEVKIRTKELTLEKVDKEAYQKAEKIINSYFQKKPTIIRKKVLKKSLKNSKIIVDVFFAIEEDITSYQAIQEEKKEE